MAICAFFDCFYTEEGALLKSVGMTAEQSLASGGDFYAQNDLTDGAYIQVEENEQNSI